MIEVSAYNLFNEFWGLADENKVHYSEEEGFYSDFIPWLKENYNCRLTYVAETWPKGAYDLEAYIRAYRESIVTFDSEKDYVLYLLKCK